MAQPNSSLSVVNYIIGISDGLILPLIPCGLISLYFSNESDNDYGLILIALYLTTICIGSIVYGLARYLGEKNEIKHNHPDIAKSDFLKDKERLKQIGIDDTLITEMMQQINKEQSDWLKEIKENDMNWDSLDIERAKRSGMQTGLGFLIGACLVALPLFFFSLNKYAWPLFLISEFILMLSFGWLKGKYLHKGALITAAIQLMMGVLVLFAFIIIVLIIANPYR